MRIIDADRAKEIAEVSLGDIFLQTALKLLIDKVPTIDAEPVVRCKDCRYYDDSGDYCCIWCGVRHQEHFCGEGEMK
jgi:hypothetical protein